uniref:Uncharacterized protein n=1 Tax=Chenopodium quinoa TaxID=63459 RepID=A0A803KVI7_CHEQI
GDSFYEVCKWIANTNINWDGYSLLNECNVAAMIQYQRLTVRNMTNALLPFLMDVLSEKCQEFLLAKAVECIDVKALYSLEADAIQDLVELNMHSSAHEELDWLIKSDLLELIRVKDRLRTSTIPFSILLHNEFELREIVELRYTVPPPLTVFDLISIAELRRKAEGSRFINRDHFLWAFDERGCGTCF